MPDGVSKNGVFVGVNQLAVARHVVRPFVLSRAGGLLFLLLLFALQTEVTFCNKIAGAENSIWRSHIH